MILWTELKTCRRKCKNECEESLPIIQNDLQDNMNIYRTFIVALGVLGVASMVKKALRPAYPVFLSRTAN
jgi:hypothetical protein